MDKSALFYHTFIQFIKPLPNTLSMAITPTIFFIDVNNFETRNNSYKKTLVKKQKFNKKHDITKSLSLLVSYREDTKLVI